MRLEIRFDFCSLYFLLRFLVHEGALSLGTYASR